MAEGADPNSMRMLPDWRRSPTLVFVPADAAYPPTRDAGRGHTADHRDRTPVRRRLRISFQEGVARRASSTTFSIRWTGFYTP